MAGSTRVRLYDWFRYLSLSVTSHTYANKSDATARTVLRHLPSVIAAEANLRRLDVTSSTVIVSREVSPFSRGELERSILKRSAHSVYDFDDALFEEGSLVRRVMRQRGKCATAVSASDVVIAGNDYLADWASNFSDSVFTIPSCVAPEEYLPKSNWDISEEPTIVWLGSPSTEQYVAVMAPALAEIHARCGARLRLISGSHGNPNLASISHMVDRVPWKPGGVAVELNSADIAIGPLADSPFARGKCAYKLLQYAATGLPMIASPIGANAEALQRFDGLHALTVADWVDGIIELLTEPASRRRKRAETGLAAVRRFYSFEAWEAQWSAAMSS